MQHSKTFKLDKQTGLSGKCAFDVAPKRTSNWMMQLMFTPNEMSQWTQHCKAIEYTLNNLCVCRCWVHCLIFCRFSLPIGVATPHQRMPYLHRCLFKTKINWLIYHFNPSKWQIWLHFLQLYRSLNDGMCHSAYSIHEMWNTKEKTTTSR